MKKENNRDDFSRKTIDSLRRRAGNRCSNPECRVPTDAPSEEGPEKVNSIGEAAHITAAAPGGPRYNPALDDERKSIHNGIWLCANCADKIDKDEKTYTVTLLHEWKKKAEESATRELGKKLPDEIDAVNTLVAAATGQTAVFLPSLVPNAIKATSGCLEKLDPRFTIETNYNRGITGFTLHPKEIVNFKMIANKSCSKEVGEKFNELFRHGRDIAIDLSAVKIEGLPIVEKFSKDIKGGFVRLENLEKQKIILKIKTVSPDAREGSSFYDLHGYAVWGTESIRIEAQGLDGLVSINIKLPRSGNFVEFTFSINFNLWDKCELNSIEYFNRIYDLHSDINNKWKMNFSIEAKGLPFLSFSYSDDGAFSDRFLHLDFIRMARCISGIIKCPIYYNSSFNVTDDLYLKIKGIHEALSKGKYTSPFHGTIRMEITASSCASAELFNQRDDKEKFFLIRHDQTEDEKIPLFDQEVALPRLSRIFTKVKLEIVNSNNDIKTGDLLEIKLLPAENCECILEKISDARSD
jgi:hypothetical protein